MSALLTSITYAVAAMSSLSGGENFLYSILANTSQAFCWSVIFKPTIDLVFVSPAYQNIVYSHIVVGKSHVCAVRGSYYADRDDSGTVDCWEIVKTSNNLLIAKQSDFFSDQSVANLEVKTVISGEEFTGGLICWGPSLGNLGVSNVSKSFAVLAVGLSTVCSVFNFFGELSS